MNTSFMRLWARNFTLRRLALSAVLVLGSALLIPISAAPVPAQTAEPQAAVLDTAEVDKLSINSADAEQIAAMLIGVGRRKAEAIVRYREQFGPFGSIEELTEVQGIGAATLARNRAVISLD